jgi:MOSC domain-containing protein YiiM
VNVEAIHTRGPDEGDVRSVESIRAIAGQGLEGDRYFFPDGAKPGLALTLVEAEVVADVGLELGETRRQLTVRGVALNDLIGKRFRVGSVICRGIEICEPCLHLQDLTRQGIIKDLLHRGGLNADILTDGTISVGDEIVVL